MVTGAARGLGLEFCRAFISSCVLCPQAVPSIDSLAVDAHRLRFLI
jgi:NAD(P)-dependent dehydrogenase (short-subunit alcohol dehydrogenase family)